MRTKIPFALIKCINVILVSVPYIVVWFAYYEPLTMTKNSRQVSTLMLVLYMLFFFSFAKRLDGFRVSIRRKAELIFGQIIAVGITDVIAALMIWMLSIHFPNLIPGFICFAVQCVLIVIVSLSGFALFFATHPPKKSVVIYDVRQGMENLVTEYRLQRRYDMKATFPVEEVIAALSLGEGETNDALEQLQIADTVFMCGVHSHDRNIIIKYCIENSKSVNMIPRVGDVMMSGAERVHMFHLPIMRLARYNPPIGFTVIKRLFDIIISGISLVVLSPVFLIVSLLVKSDGGPAFYKQIRLTKDGKEFEILKFRSMRVDAEKYSGAVLSAGENDPRITKVGRFIRACRLDELPQLINIFVGDMSIVGPRPERPEIAAQYEKELPEFRLRLQCKAGLTGYAQVYGKYNTEPYDKLLMDLMYISQPSFLEDLIIMLATIKILFEKDSTEGVGAESVTLVYEERNKNE